MSGARSSRILAHYFFLTYLLTLALCRPYLERAWLPGFAPQAYALELELTQAAFYLLPALLLTRLAHRLLRRRNERDPLLPGRHHAVCGLAFALTLPTALALSADARVFEIFGFHLNGFVLNLLATPGGIDSMGLGREGVTALARGFAALAALLLAALWAAQRIARPEGQPAGALRRRLYAVALTALLPVALTERVTYALGEARSNGSLVAQASLFPLYFPLTARNLLLDLGFGSARDAGRLDLDPGRSRLRYPLAPLRIEPPAHAPNLVWLVAESLRWDALDPEIMPASSALARDAWRFTRHHSGGNGTRMGMFSLFYGLHGPYWFEFLEERRSPVWMDVLQQQGYQLGLFTSARFSYPEFDRTIFARVPASQLHDSAENYDADDWERGWRNDRARVSDLLGFLAARDRARPFFAFMFFESTHYRYYFPDESVIRTPYARDLDLEDLASRENAELSHARYVNAAHHIDGQIARILDYLRADGRLADTVVLITGDHGEEFYEKGRKGHNSEFHEEQIHVPLVLWIPGDRGHVVERATSHVDVVPTLLPLLGLRNPASDYALGADLRGGAQRAFTVVADWSRIGLAGPDSKLTLPLTGAGLLEASALTGPDDEPLADPGVAWRSALPDLRRVIADLHRFRSGPASGDQ